MSITVVIVYYNIARIVCVACNRYFKKEAEFGADLSIFLPSSFSHSTKVSALASATIMVPQLDLSLL